MWFVIEVKCSHCWVADPTGRGMEGSILLMSEPDLGATWEWHPGRGIECCLECQSEFNTSIFPVKKVRSEEQKLVQDLRSIIQMKTK